MREAPVAWLDASPGEQTAATATLELALALELTSSSFILHSSFFHPQPFNSRIRSGITTMKKIFPIVTDDYFAWMQSVKDRVRAARYRAQVAANQDMLLLYCDLGHDIIERQQAQGWGKAVIPQMAKDLAAEFPEMKGFSERNLGYMKRFAKVWPR